MQKEEQQHCQHCHHHAGGNTATNSASCAGAALDAQMPLVISLSSSCTIVPWLDSHSGCRKCRFRHPQPELVNFQLREVAKLCNRVGKKISSHHTSNYHTYLNIR